MRQSPCSLGICSLVWPVVWLDPRSTRVISQSIAVAPLCRLSACVLCPAAKAAAAGACSCNRKEGVFFFFFFSSSCCARCACVCSGQGRRRLCSTRCVNTGKGTPDSCSANEILLRQRLRKALEAGTAILQPCLPLDSMPSLFVIHRSRPADSAHNAGGASPLTAADEA